MKNQLQTVTTLQRKGYNKTTINDMIKALEVQEVFERLRLCQQTEFNNLKTKFAKLKYLTKPYLEYLWSLYFNFVLLNFSFKETQQYHLISKPNPQHIGMKIYNSVTN